MGGIGVHADQSSARSTNFFYRESVVHWSLNISYFSFNQTLHRNFNHPFFARPIQPRQPSLALHNPSSLATSSLKCEVIRRQLLLLLESSYRPPQSLLALSITNVISAVTSRFYLKLSTPGPGLDHAHVHSFHVIFLLKFKTLWSNSVRIRLIRNTILLES